MPLRQQVSFGHQGADTAQRTPLVDHHAHHAVEDALTALAGARGAWLGDTLTEIALITSVIQAAEHHLPHLSAAARTNGRTWQEIAHALDTTPHDAADRYDPTSPTADRRSLIDLY